MRVTVQRAVPLSAAQRSAVRAAGLGPLLRRAGDEVGVGGRRSLTLRLSDDAELTRLNAQWMRVAGPTDVLAFPADEPAVVGDIVLSVERALAQAADGVAELRLLAVHGLLHCLGHDHAEPAEAAEMTRLTRRLLPGQDIPDLETHG